MFLLVPKVFAFAFSLVKNLLNDYTLSKIHIYKSEPHKWKPVLLENIAPDQLPEIYGGTMVDPDGNPSCPSKVKPGGKVPKSFYLKNQIVENDRKDEYKFTTVKKGDKLCLDFDVDTPGSFLRWGFLTDGHDIKFGIVKKDKTGKEIPEIPLHRVMCDQNEEEGFLPCETTGTYRVIFDNTYSYLRSKKLHYLIEVTPPLAPAASTDLELIAESSALWISNSLSGLAFILLIGGQYLLTTRPSLPTHIKALRTCSEEVYRLLIIST
ncbi:hypothetical protein GE061_018014 [Apolygus lucorum]|uniref:GOLD domain-containing protein n=1 Tax=Apolygus lucorum TaxID=248454 RepID=A0A8S9XES6_APOLU|nr:hypothetical protein GE061_018014 [Apolygus lucorum]